MNAQQKSTKITQSLTSIKSNALPSRTHCRICETRLQQSDDPFWGMCETCLETHRDYWLRVYDPPYAEPAATGVIPRPNRNA